MTMEDTLKQVLLPLMASAANVINELTLGITMQKAIKVTQVLAEAERVRAQLLSVSAEIMGVAQVTVGVDGNVGPDDRRFTRLGLLEWLNGLNGMKAVGKCRVNLETGKLELVVHYNDMVCHVTDGVITINAGEEVPAPTWLMGILEELSLTFKHPTWSMISVSQFLNVAGPILRGA